MWRALRPVLYNHCFDVATARCFHTLHKECILRSHPWLLRESCPLLKRYPGLVESSMWYCTQETSDPPDNDAKEIAKNKEEIFNKLFQSNPNLHADIVAKMIEESKYFEENTLLEMKEIKEDYLLTDSDLKGLKSLRRKTPYSSRELMGQKFIYVFYKTEVEKLALKKYGNMAELKKRKQKKMAEENKLSLRVSHIYNVAKRALSVKEKGEMSTGGVVLFAFTINAVILYFKLMVFLSTGSQVVFAEVIHSCVDLLNQFILLIGQVISNYPADDKFPYGHRNYLYISSMGSGGFIFAFGCLATLLVGVKGFFSAPAVITQSALNESLTRFLGIGVAELGCLGYALLKYHRDAKAKNLSLWKCIKEGDDPLTKVVIMEDSASVIGLIVCAVSMMGQYYFGLIYGFPVCDILGNFVITGMLGYISNVLLKDNSEKLVGKSLFYEEMIVDDIRRYRFVNGVFDVKSIDHDQNSRFKAEIELDAKQIARYIYETSSNQEELLKLMQGLTETDAAKVLFVNYSQKFYTEIVKFIDDLEEDLKEKYPEVRHIDIELSGGELPEELKASNVGQTKK